MTQQANTLGQHKPGRYILIGSNCTVAETDSLLEVLQLLEEADQRGFDVVDVFDRYTQASVPFELIDPDENPGSVGAFRITYADHEIPY
jgi:hypothetical protein